MMDVTVNLPEVVAEVRALFERYEQARIDKNVEVLEPRDPHARPRSATVNLEFKVRGQDAIGRQSQTWVRFPDLGWKVVSAHVSAMSSPPPR
jgi:hypothetical protein